MLSAHVHLLTCLFVEKDTHTHTHTHTHTYIHTHREREREREREDEKSERGREREEETLHPFSHLGFWSVAKEGAWLYKRHVQRTCCP